MLALQRVALYNAKRYKSTPRDTQLVWSGRAANVEIVDYHS